MQNGKLILASALAGLLLTGNTNAHAQDAATPKPAPVAALALPDLNKKMDALITQEMLLRDLIAKVTAQTGVKIVVDSVTGAKLITLNLRAGTLAEAMKQIGAQAGQGTTVRYVALPIQEPLPTGDAITQALVAQDALKPLRVAAVAGSEVTDTAAPRKRKPAIAPDQSIVASDTSAELTIEIAGRPVAFDKAAPLVAALNLTPVYVVMNPLGDNPVAKSSRLQTESLQVWLGMTADQRKQSMEAQLNGILGMEPSTRRALFGQMTEQAQGMMQKIMALPSEQRKAFFSDLTGGKFDGSTLPTPGTPPAGTPPGTN